jgi:protein O-mannosyl-transferase
MESSDWKTVLRQALAHPAPACALLVVVTLAAFWPVTHAAFINFDDPDYVTENARVQAGVSWSGAAWALRAHYASNWHPLTWLSHMLDVSLFGKGAAGPHCVNLFLHSANGALLFLWLCRMTGVHWRSFLVAALFALHPLHVESVAWIAERKDVLSTFFWMLTLLMYGRYVEQSKVESAKSKTWYGLALVCFAFGLMSKPMLVTLPFVLLLLDYWPLSRFGLNTPGPKLKTFLPLIREKGPFFLLSAGSCAVTILAQRGAIQSLTGLPLGLRAANSVVAYVRYLGKAFWPAGLAIPYPYPPHWPEGQVILAGLLMAGLCAGAWWGRRRWPFLLTGWFWFLGGLVPVIGLVQVGTQAMADRYTYVPLIGLFVVIVWGAAALQGRWRLPKTLPGLAAVLLLAACGVLTWRQASYWQDSERLFRHAAAVTKNNHTALANIAAALFARGELDEAISYCRKALEAKPDYPDALNNLGAALEKKGGAESMDYYREALRLNPFHSGALYNLGNALLARGRNAEAADCFAAVLRVKPDNLEARNNFANELLTIGRIDEAISQYRIALSLHPANDKVLKNLGAALVRKGKLDEASIYYRRALKVEPDDGTAHYALGLVLALQAKWDEAIQHYTASVRLLPPNPEVEYNLGYAFRMSRKLPEAVVHLGEALRLRPEFPLAHFNLACVLAQQARREEALAHLTEALRLQPDYPEARQKLVELNATPEDKDGK